jgi:hypothetical protein
MSYTAAVLTPYSQALLKELLEGLCPNTYEWLGHHCTIRMGFALPEDSLGSVVRMTIGHFAKDERVCAVKVDSATFSSANATPHITLAVNREGGGKPKDSNLIQNWVPLKDLIDTPYIVLIAKIEECH